MTEVDRSGVTEVGRLHVLSLKLFQEEIQKALAAYDKEQKSKKHVDSMREKNPSDRHRLVREYQCGIVEYITSDVPIRWMISTESGGGRAQQSQSPGVS